MIPRRFRRCKLDFSEREKNRELYDLHIDLLKLRREDSRFRQQEFGWYRWRGAGCDEFRPPIFFGSQRRSPFAGELWRTPGFASCFGAFAGPAVGLPVGNAVDERLAALRRRRHGCNRNSGPMDLASRVDGGITAGDQGMTASQPSLSLDGWKPSFLETSLHAPHSHRITSG